MSSKAFLLSVLSLVFAAVAPMAAPATKASASTGETLDQKRIHAEYNEGNFERVVAALEGFMSRNKTYSLEDSVFIAKHLAVVYSASPETREKGKYYMYRLLALVPSAKLIDMYVSDEIERIFDKVKEEFLARQKSFGVDSTRVSVPEKPEPAPRIAQQEPQGGAAPPKPAAPNRARRSNTKFYVAAGGAALVAAGVTSYFLLASSPKKTEKTYDIP